MEIKKIEKHVADYPKTNEISKQEIKNKIPKKFLKMLPSLLIVESWINTKVLAVSAELAGDIQVQEPIAVPLDGVMKFTHPIYTIAENVGKLSSVVFLLSLISLISSKVVHKLKKSEKQIPKILKVTTAISFVIVILSLIGVLLYK